MQTSVLRCYARAARWRRPAPGPTQRPPPPPPPSAAEADTVPTSGKRASVMGSGEWEGGMAGHWRPAGPGEGDADAAERHDSELAGAAAGCVAGSASTSGSRRRPCRHHRTVTPPTPPAAAASTSASASPSATYNSVDCSASHASEQGEGGRTREFGACLLLLPRSQRLAPHKRRAEQDRMRCEGGERRVAASGRVRARKKGVGASYASQMGKRVRASPHQA